VDTVTQITEITLQLDPVILLFVLVVAIILTSNILAFIATTLLKIKIHFAHDV
jgi:uncharacterized membrane protein YfbV (UPF0208 family)